MRGPLLVAALLLAVMMSGCLADVQNGDGTTGPGTSSGNEVVGTDAEGNPIKAGDDLGELTFEDDGTLNSAVTQPDCTGGTGSSENHIWTIPQTNTDGIGWKAEDVTVVVTKSATAIDLDVVLSMNGKELDHATEVGPDEGDTITVEASNVSPGDLSILVRACTSAVMASYSIDGTADMVAVAAASGSTSEDQGSAATGDVSVEQKTDGDGNIYYEASRQETYTATLTGSTGTADISTGGGVIDYDAGGGDDYRLVATLKARGDSEQSARERLAEMYVDHTAQDGVAVVLDVHGRPGGDGSWNRKQIDLHFDAPDAIDWTAFDAAAGGGIVDLDQVTADAIGIDTGGGIARVTGSDADSLDVLTGGGIVTVSDTRANDMDLNAGGGSVSASMRKSTAGGAWDLSAGGGTIELKLVETSRHGYQLDATNPGGSISFDFDDIEETSNNCNYGYCSNRQAETNGYDSRDIKVTVDLTIGGGSIHAYS